MMAWFRTPPCTHSGHDSKFMDFHTSGDGEVYVRSYSQCRNCTHGWYSAVKLPDVVASVLQQNMEIGTLERKPTDSRAKIAYALEEVYYNIDKREIFTAVNEIIHTAMKKAFEKN